MRHIVPRFLTICVAIVGLEATAATITHWNFNSNPPDNNTGTGTLAPASGNGTAARLGGPAPTYATGSANDPASTDNSGANTQGYPAQGAGNKTSGMEFRTGTRGHTNIAVAFEQRISNTGSRYFRFQYTTDGSNFIDGPVIDLAPGNAFVPKTVSLGAIEAVNDNTNFACRIVAEFESTATGGGSNGYVTITTTGYSANGASRFDLVTVSGDPIDASNLPPSITSIPDQTILENSDTGDLPFVIADFETPVDQLTLSAASSNTNLVPVENIVISATAEGKALRVTPAANQFGAATITLVVTDLGGLSATNAFVLTVIPLNASPTITAISRQSTLVNTAIAPIAFTVGDLETAGDALNVTASSSNPALIPLENILISSTGTERLLTATPTAGQLGTAAITVRVTDAGGRSASASFNLMVVPTATTLLYETFGYANGPLTTNSASLWATHDGIAGQTQVSNELASLQFFQSEDLHAPLLGNPYATGNGTVLYASLQLHFTGLPLAGGQYFAHFRNNGSTFRGRLFATTTNASPNTVRLGVANAAGAQSVQVATDLSLSNTYTAVIRYAVDSGITTLWVDPTAETDASVTASDSPAPAVVTDFSFRQTAGIGNIIVDNIKVATTFADVVTASGFRLRIQTVNNTIEVIWPQAAAAAGFRLQSNVGLDANGWSDATETPSAEGDDLVVRLTGTTGSRFFRLIR